MEGWERIKLIIEKEGLNKNSFSAAIGLNNNVTITRIINEHRSPSKYKINKDTLFVMDNGGESMVFLKQSSKDNDELFNKIATYIKTPEDIKQEIEQLLKLEP